MTAPTPETAPAAAAPAQRRSGYTLPVWVAAAARAALAVLLAESEVDQALLQLSEADPSPQALPVRAAARLADGWALAETCCDPGDGLDLTRGLAVWVQARLEAAPAAGDPCEPAWSLEAGDGVGVHADSGLICTSAYARWLLQANLTERIPAGQRLRLRLVLPRGHRLAERTSNAAFGVVDGLALIGTQAETQASADPDQLERSLELLRARLADPAHPGDLVLVIGENGLDLAPRLGLPPQLLLKCGNWIGPLLVAAGQGGVRRLLLFGVQGKLVKLAGGIFHTHHHLADGRREVLTALAALEGMEREELLLLHGAATVDAALATLEARAPDRALRLRRRLAAEIEARSLEYLRRHQASGPRLGVALFDRSRRIRITGPVGSQLLQALRGVAPAAGSGSPAAQP